MQFIHPDFPNIEINTEVCFGKPCIKNTRMPISSIVAYLTGGMSVDEFVGEFDWITKEDVYQALGYASLQLEESFMPLQKAV